MRTKLAEDIAAATMEKLAMINFGSKGGLLNMTRARPTSILESRPFYSSGQPLSDFINDLSGARLRLNNYNIDLANARRDVYGGLSAIIDGQLQGADRIARRRSLQNASNNVNSNHIELD